MKTKTIFLVILAIAGFVWACSFRDGISWFPGFLVCVSAANGAFDSTQEKKNDIHHE